MANFQKMSESEMEVMHVIWNLGGSATSNEIQAELNKSKDWKLTTILTFLARLVEKDIVISEKKENTRANQYTCLISESEYKSLETHSFLNTVHNGSIKSFITALYNGNDLKEDDIEDLKKWFSKTKSR